MSDTERTLTCVALAFAAASVIQQYDPPLAASIQTFASSNGAMAISEQSGGGSGGTSGAAAQAGWPAARISVDMHACGGGGGPIQGPGIPTVLIGPESQPAAMLDAFCPCATLVAGLPDTIYGPGSSTVFIGNFPAIRAGDKTLSGGLVATGCPTVLIG